MDLGLGGWEVGKYKFSIPSLPRRMYCTAAVMLISDILATHRRWVVKYPTNSHHSEVLQSQMTGDVVLLDFNSVVHNTRVNGT